MNLIRQPKGSKLCGQSSIAMLAGITLEESIGIFGHGTTSYIKDYKKALDNLGIKYNPLQKVDSRRKWSLPKTALVRIEYVGRNVGHLVAYKNGKIYDPSNGIYNSKEELLEDYRSRHMRRVRIDWYIEILDKG